MSFWLLASSCLVSFTQMRLLPDQLIGIAMKRWIGIDEKKLSPLGELSH
jgi:hypothetical protein